ncbi:TonB-dependent receptor domain-containing protein [Novosphingobium sp.]|uniref:TonB-dependent receptor domain-containing protein n=1 Tax=Novosphingobium sp. TaxID=1874826 RepID=UPI002734C246|nr:TonB-dependent receptor [Novosphingobium sp.]
MIASPAFAAADPQDVPDSAEAASQDEENLLDRGGDIVVMATRVAGQVEAPQPPIATLDEKDLQSLGAANLTDVLARISPQTTSGRGRGGGMPVVLVNGQRITNFREMRNFPPEAVRRVEILPEEVALRFGYPADARVVNFILKDNFASKTVEVETGVPTRGGFQTYEVEGTALRIAGKQRFSVTGKIDDTSPLTEAERGVIQSSAPTVSTDPDPAAARTLIADSRELSLGTAWSRGLGKDGLGGQISLSGNAARSDSRSLSGLNLVVLTAPGGASAIRSVGDPLERLTRSTTLQAGAGFNTFLGSWQLNATLDGSHGESRTLIDRRLDTSSLVSAAAAGTLVITGALPAPGDPGQDTVRSNTEAVTSLVTLVGRPTRLPGGEVTTTLKGGFAWSNIDSSDSRSTVGPVSLKRGDLSAGVNLGIPITSRREGFGAGLGDISLNFSAGLNHLSDFGAIKDWSAGLTWSPVEGLGLQASYLVNEAAPSLGQLGNPQTITFNVPVYDFTRGETVLAAVTSGGNPALLKERQRDLKFGANWKLPFLNNSNLLVEYFRNRSNDVTTSFPLLTPDIEAAFPGRVTRDATGRIIAVDQRPVTFAEQASSRLRWGFNLAGTLGKAPEGAPGGMMMGGGRPAGPGGAPGGRPPGAGGGGGRGGMMAMMGGPGGGQGRWNLGVYHTVQFDSTVLVAPGGPLLDLLGGDALSAGGQPRHALEMNGGLFRNGFGMFLNGSWMAPATIRATGTPGSSDLRFGSVTKLRISAFADLGARAGLIKAAPFLKGSRVSLRVDNLFDSRQKVTDASGTVPLSYQPDYLDPRGRVIEVEFRKMF